MKHILVFLMCALFVFSGYDAFAKSTSTTSSSRSSSSSTRSSNSMSSGTYKSPNKPAYVAPKSKPVVVQSRPVATQPKPVIVQQSKPVQIKQVVVNKPVNNVVPIKKDIPVQQSTIVKKTYVTNNYYPASNDSSYNHSYNGGINNVPRFFNTGIATTVVKQQFKYMKLASCKGWDCK